jgi:hypothetical protein
LIHGEIRFPIAASGIQNIRINKNGVPAAITGTLGNLSMEADLIVSAIENLSINDRVELLAYQSSGSPLNVLTTTYSPKFSMVMIG